MVSLRKSSSSTPKFMFTEGERVLCYEPDPNKAKVLYDSKIIDVIHTNKKAEYSVHFFGWSNAWNRTVCEQYILKDTPSNRQLQRELAAQAAGSLKGKKLKLNKIPTIIKDVMISSLNCNEQEIPNSKDGFEQISNIDSVFIEDSSNSNFFTQTTNSNSTINENTNHSILTNCDFQNAVSAINTNQTIIKSVNEANIFTIINNQISTNCSNLTASDNHYQNQELCQQIINNLDEQLKNLLEKDQQLICVEKVLYDLPVTEYTVHKIMVEYQKFGLRMLNSSKQLSNNLDESKNENLKDQSNHTCNQAFQTTSNTRTNSRANQLNNHSTINNQINQSNQTNNFISSNSSASSGSSNGLNTNKQILQFKDASTAVNATNSTPNSFTNQTLREFTNSVEIYFNTLTDKMYLFYSDKEREQYKQLKQLEVYLKPVHTFGFIHLLRLIILLPDFLSFCSIPTKQLKQVIFILKHFCNYLLENKTKFTS